LVPVTPGTNYTLTIPAAATAPTNTLNNVRIDGGNVTFTGNSGVAVTAVGGQGGQTKIEATTATATGLNGAGSTTGCVGDVGGIFAGGSGALTNGILGSGGAGGGGGGDTAAGGDGVGYGTGSGGAGGVNGGGAGGIGRGAANNGQDGTAPGGGGGGAKAQGTGSFAGGAGGVGQIILTYVQLAAVQPPTLGHSLSGGNVVLSWSGSGFKVQVRTNLTSGTWSDVPGGTNSPVNITPTLPAAYYRLTQQ